jgi:hypothetical protein
MRGASGIEKSTASSATSAPTSCTMSRPAPISSVSASPLGASYAQ